MAVNRLRPTYWSPRKKVSNGPILQVVGVLALTKCVIIQALSATGSLTLDLVAATRRGRSSEFGREHKARPLGERTHHRKAALHHAHKSEQMAGGSKPPYEP
jgi:hypothetical protein